MVLIAMLIQEKLYSKLIYYFNTPNILFFLRKRMFGVLGFYLIIGSSILAQTTFTSKNNYTGTWEDPTSWNPIWEEPLSSIIDANIAIYGYITCNNNLELYGNNKVLTINDTLVIQGDLTLGNLNKLVINNQGVLIIMGNLYDNNKSEISIDTKGSIVIKGDFIKEGSELFGSFISYNNPTNVFVLGSVDSGLNPIYFPVFQCPGTTPYLNSNCSYGNFNDLETESIFSIFQENCSVNAEITMTENSSLFENDGVICQGNPVILKATGGNQFKWSTGETSNEITCYESGTYSVEVTNNFGCKGIASADISVIKPPDISFENDVDVCGKNYVLNTSLSEGDQNWSFISGAGDVSFSTDDSNQTNSVEVSDYGSYILRCTVSNQNCIAFSDLAISFQELPSVNLVQDQVLNDSYTTTISVDLKPSETCKWNLLSGMGIIEDSQSPSTNVNNLGYGNNVFECLVSNEYCSSKDEVVITINELFVPQVITPNGDGKNDFFIVDHIEHSNYVKLIIHNRWGDEVYSHPAYKNDWDGKNNNGAQLSNDTYYYFLIISEGAKEKVRKGFVVIKR